MKSEVNLRFAAYEDAEILAKLGRETFHDAFVNHPLMPKADLNLYLNEAFTVSQITSELSDPQAAFLLAEIDGQAVGYAKFITEGLEARVVAKNPVKLKRLYIRQEFVGAGIGAGLFSRCLAETAKNGHDRIWLTVWEHNKKAQDFYRKWGFKPFGVIDFQFGNTVLTDILMQKSLYKDDKIRTISREAENYMIRKGTDEDFEEIFSIINDAAMAYKGVIPPDRWHEPYMIKDELQAQIEDGVRFSCYVDGNKIIGVMGIQDKTEVRLIRHAYVRTKQRNRGIGTLILRELIKDAKKPILIGTWKAADWAISFYEKHRFWLVEEEEKNYLLKKYWTIPDRQIETSVVLVDEKYKKSKK